MRSGELRIELAIEGAKSLSLSHTGDGTGISWGKFHRASLTQTLGALASPLCYPFLFASPLAHLSRELGAELDFFASYAALCSREEALIVVQHECYALDNPVETNEPFQSALALRRRLVDRVFGFLHATKEERCPAFPQWLGDNVGSWCPICNGEYLEKVGECPECRVPTLEREPALGREPTP